MYVPIRTGMTGSITETYTVVPQYKGNYPIRPLTFSFFDPKTESLSNLTSQEIIINVENGPVTAQKEEATERWKG